MNNKNPIFPASIYIYQHIQPFHLARTTLAQLELNTTIIDLARSIKSLRPVLLLK